METRHALLVVLFGALAACQTGGARPQRIIANTPEGRMCVRDCIGIDNQCRAMRYPAVGCPQQHADCLATCPEAPMEAQVSPDVASDRVQECWEGCYKRQNLCDDRCHANSKDLTRCTHRCAEDKAACRDACGSGRE